MTRIPAAARPLPASPLAGEKFTPARDLRELSRRLGALLLVLAAALIGATPAAARFASDRITVRVEGAGPDVILVPGLTSSPTAWEKTVPAVPGYRYHLVQVKGFAGTPVDGNSTGALIPALADELARYAREERLKTPAIVGHSMGGSVALSVAARHPGAVSRVMVVDMLPFMGAMLATPGTPPTVEGVTPAADALTARMNAATPQQRNAMLTQMTGAMVANAAMRPKVVEQAIASDRRLVTDTYRELMVTDLRPDLAKIAVPVTILYVTPAGAPLTDAQIDGFYAASYANLKGAKLVRVPDSAHFIMFDNPDRFATELKAFLKP